MTETSAGACSRETQFMACLDSRLIFKRPPGKYLIEMPPSEAATASTLEDNVLRHRARGSDTPVSLQTERSIRC
jgi:hypothetical protein